MASAGFIQGYAQDVLGKFAPDSIDCCVTSPPYWGLRDYGIEPSVWGGEGCGHDWCAHLVNKQAGRRDTGRNFTGGGGNYQQDGPVASFLQESQFCSLCNAWRGALGLEPTPQLFIEHMVSIFEQVRRVLKPSGTCWLNIGDSYCSTAPGTRNAPQHKGSPTAPEQWANMRPDTPPGLKPKDLCLIPFRLAIALQEAGWYVRSDIIWAKPNPMPESVRDRPTKAHEYIFLLAKSLKYHFDADAVREPHVTFSEKSKMMGGRNHFGKRSGTPEQGKNKGNPNLHMANWDQAFHPKGRNIRSVWTVASQPFPEAHFAVFPSKLIEPCIKAGCPADGLVLDPFSGAGTTALVSQRLGRDFIGIEPNADYIAMARRRLKKEKLLLP